LKITITGKKGEQTKLDVARSFTQWFDFQGRFIVVPFQEMLATEIPLVGKLDPKRIKSATHELLESSPGVLDALLAASSASATGSAVSAEATAKKAGKRRKA
jgi:signal peptidase complex subunit 2